MKSTTITGLFIFLLMLVPQFLFGGESKDQEGKLFKTVQIGEQEWMAENLNVSTFRNGDSLAEAGSRAEWQQAYLEKKPVWCYYGNDPDNGDIYGRLYNWYAVIDSRGLAPEGWHIPADTDWHEMIDYLGGEAIAGYKLKSEMGWKEGGSGSNESRFSALPGGACAADGYLGSIGYLGVWWSTSEDTAYYYDATAQAWYRYLYFSKNNIIRYSHSKGNGFSVRCIRDTKP